MHLSWRYILLDLCGPKIRAKRGYFANIITLLIYQDWLIDLFTYSGMMETQLENEEREEEVTIIS